MRTSARPSSPEGSGFLSFSTQSEKYTNSAAKLVALGKRFFLFALAMRDLCFERLHHFVSRIHLEHALRADDFKDRPIGHAEATGEGSETIAGKLKQTGRRRRHLAKALVVVSKVPSENFFRLGAKQISRGIDAIDAQVIDSTTTNILLEPRITWLDLL